MKTLALVFLLIAIKASAVLPQSPVTWPIWWDAPTNMPPLSYYSPGTNQAYQLLVTQTMGTPLTNWPVVVTWTNWFVVTNGSTITFSNNYTAPFGQTFFYLNPTNTWGAAPLLSGYGAWEQTGPSWSVITNSVLGKP